MKNNSKGRRKSFLIKNFCSWILSRRSLWGWKRSKKNAIENYYNATVDDGQGMEIVNVKKIQIYLKMVHFPFCSKNGLKLFFENIRNSHACPLKFSKKYNLFRQLRHSISFCIFNYLFLISHSNLLFYLCWLNFN